MIYLNPNDLQWFNKTLNRLVYPQGSSPASEIYACKGVNGIARLHEAIKRRDVARIQWLLDNLSRQVIL